MQEKRRPGEGGGGGGSRHRRRVAGEGRLEDGTGGGDAVEGGEGGGGGDCGRHGRHLQQMWEILWSIILITIILHVIRIRSQYSPLGAIHKGRPNFFLGFLTPLPPCPHFG